MDEGRGEHRLNAAPGAAIARFLPFEAASGAWNMAVDEALLAQGGPPTLRFYGWDPPTVSLGHFQARRQAVGGLLDSGLPAVVRMTGGGAIVHWHELTYSVVLGQDHPALRGLDARASYAALHAPIVAALASLGVRASARAEDEAAGGGPGALLCFARATRLDLVAGGRKLVGSAQRRRGGRVLQHGSIVLRTNPLQPATAALEDLLGRTVEAAEVAGRLRTAFEAVLGPLAEGRLTAAERAHAAKAAPAFVIR